MSAPLHNDQPHRVTKPLFTFGTITLLLIMGIGYAFGITRMLLGLGRVTNLDNHNPWGIWISFDVACGVALAAGGFTTAALVDIFGRNRYKALLRPAILTAFLGYLWVAIALSFDLGRYWNIWRPIFYWQGNSVLFEVGMCVTFYLFVLSVEMTPSVLEGLLERRHDDRRGRWLLGLERALLPLYRAVRIVLPLFIVAGVVLSCMHQSSLGTLMLISPTKLSPLWNTPILPILFLMSAMMVGFPMVILESVYANISFGRNPEMDLLTPLSGIIPWFLGAYGVVKIGDLVVRHGQLDLLAHPAATTSLAVEILLGVVAPFLLFLNKAVRRSMGWLFFTVTLIIFGVILNRINVFLVGYMPAYADKPYFPSVGELAMTAAIVSSILFFYRFFVTFFPILPGYVPATDAELARMREERGRTVSPFWTWVIRATAIGLLIGFVALYTLVHVSALQTSVRTVEDVRRVQAQQPAFVAVTAGYPARPAAYTNFYVLDSPLLRARSDDYEPVTFAHRIHDDLVGGDCGACHHRFASEPTDRVGRDVKELHNAMGIKVGGACSSCHDNLENHPPQACSRCHGQANERDAPARIGLKGAYHRQCIGCHERQLKPASAPTACADCHHPWTPDHRQFAMTLPARALPQDVTRACLGCHAKVGQDLLNTAHWNWKGYSPTLKGYEHRIDISLTAMVNNSCIAIGPNMQECASCHIGYGWVDAKFDFKNPANIDCLVCHDTTGMYRKDLGRGGRPDPSLDLAAVARAVGRPSRQTCGSCHFVSGGPYAKHGDLEPALADPTPGFDVHMGMLHMRCQDCHTTTEHRVAGMSMGAPAVEGRVGCEKCHGQSPHGVAGLLSRHLDDHVRAVACETCHVPSIAHLAPTLLRRDYSKAGQNRPPTLDQHGMPDYDKRSGTLTWGKNVVPVYLWYDGTRTASLAGDTIDPSAPVILNAPVGEKRNPNARIFPFQEHAAVQPYDIGNKTLAMPRLLDGYWQDFDWTKAIATGMKQVGLPFSGQYGFVETRAYSSVHHEVVPARQALGCADCHSGEAVTCTRCHRGAREMDLPQHRRATYPGVKGRIDFKALGYPGDPAMVGGRFYLAIGRGTPPR